jgi:DNA-binding transcriptional ArsR family regulator
MPDRPANATDAAIVRLLAAGPASTAELAAWLAIPRRTIRHRLYRLRQAGVVATDAVGRHRLLGPATDLAAPVAAGDTVTSVGTPLSGLAWAGVAAVVVVVAGAGWLATRSLDRRPGPPAQRQGPQDAGPFTPWGGVPRSW